MSNNTYLLTGSIGVLDHQTGIDVLAYDDFEMTITTPQVFDTHNQDHFSLLATTFKETWSILQSLEPKTLQHKYGEHAHVDLLSFGFKKVNHATN